jgi:uncharacterized protein GlcG (DUF336 family)
MAFDHSAALALISKAVAIADEQGQRVACAIVDTGGRVVASLRMTGVGYVNLDAARRKATASAVFGAPTAMMSDMMGGDPKMAPVLADAEMLVLPGALPIIDGGAVVGGIGIAGMHYMGDDAIVQAVMQP